MAKAYFTKVTGRSKAGLLPACEESEKLLKKMGEGELLLMEVSRIRSGPWHRRFFAILATIAKNQDPPKDVETILTELKILAGHYTITVVKDPETEEMFQGVIPKSIAFDKLSAEGWKELYPRLEEAGRQAYGPDYWDDENIDA